jgi:hypothetical protein
LNIEIRLTIEVEREERTNERNKRHLESGGFLQSLEPCSKIISNEHKI